MGICGLALGIVRVAPDLRDTEGRWFHFDFIVRSAAGRTLKFRFLQDKQPYLFVDLLRIRLFPLRRRQFTRGNARARGESFQGGRANGLERNLI